MTIDTDELDLVAEIFEGLSNRSKMAILLGLDEGQSLKEIAATLEITQQGLEKNIDKMLEAGLVTQESTENADYALTPLGQYFVHILHDEWDTLIAAQRVVQEKERQAREKVESARQAVDSEESDSFTFQINNKTWEHTIQTQKWVMAEDELREILDLSGEEHEPSAETEDA